jgi:hypothetical protein
MPAEELVHTVSPSTSKKSDDSDLKDFQPLIDAIDPDALAAIAVECRLRGGVSTAADPEGGVRGSEDLRCEIKTPPLYGSFNLVYVLRFSDGVRWIARFPLKGASSSFGDLDRQRIVADLQTMRLIRSATTIPIPEVF